VNDRESRRCTAGPAVPPPRETLGGYVLGALDPVETDRTAAHLAECEGCRAEYLDLLDLLPLLAVITEQEAVTGPVRPHPDTLERVLSARSAAEAGVSEPPGVPSGPVEPLLLQPPALGGPAAPARAGVPIGPTVRGSRRRPKDSRPPNASGPQPRRRNFILALGAAALVGALVVAGALGLGRSHNGGPSQVSAWSASAAATYNSGSEISASVQVTTDTADAGSLIELKLAGVPAGYSCKMVMVGTDGTQESSREWTAPSAGTFTIPGKSTMAPGHIADVEVQLPDGSVLASLAQP
jgi:hypothetical protein